MTKIIGIHGKMGCGKDFIADNLIIPILKDLNQTSFKHCFGDQLKIECITKYDEVNFDNVFIKKTDKSRILLQEEGEKQRNIDKDIFIKYFDNWSKLLNYRGINYIICSDLRYKNEFDYIKKKNGILIKINSPKRNEKRLLEECKNNNEIYNKIKNHISECNLDNEINFDVIIENDSDILNEDLQKQIKLII